MFKEERIMNENIILNIDNFVTIKDNNVVIPVEIYNFIKLEIETYKNIIKYLNQEIVNKVELNLENKNVNNEELELMEEKLKYFYKNTKMPKKYKKQINEIIQINEKVEVDIIERLSK